MPPKITDSRPSPDAVHTVEERTAAEARRIVATYAEDLFDGVTLMSMLGVDPKGFVYKKYAEEHEAQAASEAEAEAGTAATKKTTKKAAKKTTKKTTKKATKKATKKTTKKTVKKATSTAPDES
ncbi:histone [Corynebacterium liangguodongii]|uniref:Histone n=1 Tax=Corynebacterium liangguodongii TaxID=2079535 RepID=A0A2S0WFR9_9CORY|nr:histone [Corynebacterium liangguodongii]AWB84633.1 histone [Corynebacterium liangguodongii]